MLPAAFFVYLLDSVKGQKTMALALDYVSGATGIAEMISLALWATKRCEWFVIFINSLQSSRAARYAKAPNEPSR
jgi:hypothetical protein